MKHFLILLIFPMVLVSQDIIDPLPIINDTTANYDIIEKEQKDFILGWNWGTPGRKLDEALFINLYHGYPKNSDRYSDSIKVIQNPNDIIIGGRQFPSYFNTQSLYLEPRISIVKPEDEVEFIPTLENENGATFGFQFKNSDVTQISDPLHPDFGKVLLFKDSVSNLPAIVLDSIWPNNKLSYYNFSAMKDNNKANGKELYLSINLKSLEPITPLNEDDVVLTIKLPYKVWNDTTNGGSYVDSNYVKFRNLPSLTDTAHIYGSRGDWRGIRKDTTDSLSSNLNVREFQITAKMLDVHGNGIPDLNITLSAYTLFNLDDDGFGGYKWNPILEPDWHDHLGFEEYIKELDVEVTYHGNLDIAIDWIRLETPQARDIYDGYYDVEVYKYCKEIIDSMANETLRNPRAFRFYGADELLEHQWGVNRYFNLLLDTLSSSEVGISRNSPPHYNHAIGFKEYWNGDNLAFHGLQATPYIEQGLVKDSTYWFYDTTLNESNVVTNIDTVLDNKHYSPDALNFRYGFKGSMKRTTDTLGFISEVIHLSLADSLNSDYETFINTSSPNNSIPFPENIWPFDSVYDSSVEGRLSYYNSSTQYTIEYYLYHYYKKHGLMLFGKKFWWANLWPLASSWVNNSNINSTTLTDRGKRPKTGEEVRLMTNASVILGTKGLLYWKKTTTGSDKVAGLAPRNFNSNYLDSLPEGENLIYSNEIGGDFKQFNLNEPNLRIREIDTTKLRLDLFDHNGERVYIGLKSARTELYKLHKWINHVSNELMDLRLQAWHAKGYKEWDEWNQYNEFKRWVNSPLDRIVHLDSVRTRKVFQPNTDYNHNYYPDYEDHDSSFFDITLLQYKDDSAKDLFNRKKSVYLGIQNRRTDPLIFRDSIDVNPVNNYGELMFFSSAEMDSNVRFGGEDLWGVNMSADWWQEKWWQRLGVRELSLPINIPIHGNGTYLVAEELGVASMDTLGWWYADSLYHRIDTSLADGDKLIAKLLPGQGKIVKMSYVPYFFNDPTKDTIPDNDSCYFCDVFNDFDLFEFDVVENTEIGGCCYDISFTYNGNCEFEDIPFRLLFKRDSVSDSTFIDDVIEFYNPESIKDSSDISYKYKDSLLSLDNTTGTVNLGTFCLGDSSTSYTISLLAGKDKGDRFIGCDREMQFKTFCDYQDKEVKDCCEGLIVSDSMYTNGGMLNGQYTVYEYCTTWKIDNAFDSDCIYSVTLGDGDVVRELIHQNGLAIDFSQPASNTFEFCTGMALCPGDTTGGDIRMTKLRFLGKDGTTVCEVDVPIWVPCSSMDVDDVLAGGPTGGPTPKSIIKKDNNVKSFSFDNLTLNLWPNPAQNELNLEINSKLSGSANISLINNLGQSVNLYQNYSLSRGRNNLNINLTDVRQGVYYIQILKDGSKVTVPFVITK